MERRTFLDALGASLLVASIGAKAQQTGKVARVGYLSSGTPTANAALHQAFIDGLRDHGWIAEKNIAIDYRWDGAGKQTLDALATELARLPLEAIFAVNTPAALAMKRTGSTVPVVFATVSEPVAIGLVDSLARPGRNFTGLTTINRELMSKRLEVLKQAIPGLGSGWLPCQSRLRGPQNSTCRDGCRRARLGTDASSRGGARCVRVRSGLCEYGGSSSRRVDRAAGRSFQNQPVNGR